MSTHPARKGISQYKPIKLLLDPIPQLQLQPVVYPPSKTRYLRAITEQVPVFEGSVHISQDIQVATGAEFWGSLGKDGKTFTITGKLEYQVRHRITCYVLTSVPVKWPLQLFQWTARVPPWTFLTNEKLSVLQHLPYALLNIQLARKNSDSVIPNGACGVRNLSFLGYAACRSFF